MTVDPVGLPEHLAPEVLAEIERGLALAPQMAETTRSRLRSIFRGTTGTTGTRSSTRSTTSYDPTNSA